jgi:hypothetical protein
MLNVIRKIDAERKNWRTAASVVELDTKRVVAEVLNQILNEANQIGEKP